MATSTPSLFSPSTNPSSFLASLILTLMFVVPENQAFGNIA